MTILAPSHLSDRRDVTNKPRGLFLPQRFVFASFCSLVGVPRRLCLGASLSPSLPSCGGCGGGGGGGYTTGVALI